MDRKIKINGRYLEKNNSLTFFNVGSGISFNTSGNGFSFNVNFNNKNGYIYLIIDRNYDKKIKIFIKNKDILKYVFDKNGNHYVDIIKANEANDNILTLSNIVLDGELLDYDFVYGKKIKVIGDSTIAGYGILEKVGCPSIDNCDGVEDFCFRTLYKLGYDFDLFAFSGWGAKFSAYTNPQTKGIYDYQKFISINCKKIWKEKQKSDILIISLGTNDQSYIDLIKTKKERLIKCFQKTLLKMIRREIGNRKMPVVMVYGSLNEKNVFSLIEQTYNFLKNKINNIKLLKLNGTNDGLSNHAFVKTHRLMSKELEKTLLSL